MRNGAGRNSAMRGAQRSRSSNAWRITPASAYRILNLAPVVGADDALRRRLRPALEAMAAEISETVFLAVPSGGEVYFLDATESPRTLRAASQRRQCKPRVGSAIGLLFLAFIPALRRRMEATHADRVGPATAAEIDAIPARGHALDRAN